MEERWYWALRQCAGVGLGLCNADVMLIFGAVVRVLDAPCPPQNTRSIKKTHTGLLQNKSSQNRCSVLAAAIEQQ